MHGAVSVFFFFQAEDGIRYLVRSRGLGDVYKRQVQEITSNTATLADPYGNVGRNVVQAPGYFSTDVGLSLIHI